MSFKPFTYYSAFVLLILSLSISACNTHTDNKESEINLQGEKDAFEIWSDTIVKNKYADGTVAEIWGFRPNDSLMHYERKFYRNGGIWIEGTAYGNIRHGKWQAFDEQGNLISMGYYKMGKGDGVKTVWHSNGKKYYEGKVFDGERIGVWEFYDENGIKIKEIDYSELKRNKKQ
jgi:antitoxin component YwqK of YwqJK toxin-antitoxin module